MEQPLDSTIAPNGNSKHGLCIRPQDFFTLFLKHSTFMSTPEPTVNTAQLPLNSAKKLAQLPLNGAKKLTQALFGEGFANGGESHCVKGSHGYTTPVFEGKKAQRASVEINVASKVRSNRCHIHQH